MEKEFVIVKRGTKLHPKLKEFVAVKRHKETGEIVFTTESWIITQHGVKRKNLEGEVRAELDFKDSNPLWKKLMREQGMIDDD